MNGLIRRRYLFEKITELEKETKDRIRKVHLGSAEYQRYMEQLNERSLMKKMILTAPAVPDINVGGKMSGEKRRCDMERLTTKFNGGYLFNLPPKKDENDIKAHEEYIDKVSVKLGEYEDAEEQGKLIILPCKVGDVVWNIDHIYECKHAYNCPLKFDNYKCEANVPCRHEYKVLRVKETVFNYKMLESIGKTVFLTKEEAEQALAKMKEV